MKYVVLQTIGFRSYLSDRRQFVSINEFNSNHAMLKDAKTWLSLMKQQLRSKLNMNWNEEFGIAKDEKFWKTSVKDYFYVANTVVLS